jgi:20S proteasome alpha/beta subunit
MSQLIACRSPQGIVLAADSLAVDFDTKGALIEVKTARLVPLTGNVAILAGGAADGTGMCQALKRFIAEEGLSDVQDIYRTALPFLASEYEQFMRKKCQAIPVDPLHHVHFILAGVSSPDAAQPYRMYLMWTKKSLPQLDGDEIGLAYSIPRRMGLEYTLGQLCREDKPLDEILRTVRKHLDALGENQEEVGAPFTYGLITREGLRQVT